MPTEIDARVKQFTAALEQLENGGDVALIATLFSTDAQLGSIALIEPLIGAAGASKFWAEYRGIFKNILSRFNHIHVSGDLAVLEWVSEGFLIDGSPVHYQGVTILEFVGDRIGRFRTYYDSAAFLAEGATLLGRK